MDHNRFWGIGRLVKDLQHFEAGRRGEPHCTGILVTNRVVPSENGPEADYIPFSVWGESARTLCRTCALGDTLLISGRIRTNLVSKASGEKGSFWEVRADNAQLIHRSRKNMQPSPKRDSTTNAVDRLSREFSP